MDNEQLIWEYLDNSLDKKNMALVDSRLAKDPQFLSEFERVKALHKLLTVYNVTKAPDNFNEIVHDKISAIQQKNAQSDFNGLKYILIVGAATLLLGFATIYLMTDSNAAASSSVYANLGFEINWERFSIGFESAIWKYVLIAFVAATYLMYESSEQSFRLAKS